MKPETPRTITIFLASGNPNGIKKLEISNRIIRAYVIPRLNLIDAKQYTELTQSALYILFDREGTRAYIGESENFYERIKNHDQSKDFWDIAVAIVAKDKSLEKGDVKFLESLAVEYAKSADRLDIENKTIPARNNIHEFKLPTLHEFFADATLLISTLGYPLFDKVVSREESDDNLWYCKGKLTAAKGIYSEAGFKVLAGSIVEATVVPSFAKQWPASALERKHKLATSGNLLANGAYMLTQGITFSSVSSASGFCLGRGSNGWTDWKNSAGKTLDETIRKSLL